MLDQADNIAGDVIHSKDMQGLWKRYQAQFSYAEDISWEIVSDVLRQTLNRIDEKDETKI